MRLYLDGKKYKINLNGIKYIVNIPPYQEFASNNIRMLSADGFVLKDKNGSYLVLKEGE